MEKNLNDKLEWELKKAMESQDPPKPYLTELVQTRLEMALEEEEDS